MGIMVAVIEVCKAALGFLPNIELTTFWLIMFTLYWGGKTVFLVPAFILLEGCMYGFGLWWIMYLYTWPLLVFAVWKARAQESVWFWSMLSAAFGLLFGFFCAIPYHVIGITEGNYLLGFTWWVAGIPWDLVHGAGNFCLMLILYRPVRHMLDRLKLQGLQE